MIKKSPNHKAESSDKPDKKDNKNVKDLEKKICDLEKEKEELARSLKQIAADFSNVRRRHEEEKTERSSLATNALIMEIFPVLDNFRRASEHAPQINIDDNNQPTLNEDDLRKISAYFEGIRRIEQQLEGILQNVGLTRIDTLGQQFDPHTMEACAYEPHPELPENTIIDELEGGYKLGDKVIRPAKVRVSSGK